MTPSSQMQWWPSGVEQNVDGVVREVPTRHVWASSVWITQEGVARRKWWNPVERRWHWDAEPLPICVNEWVASNIGGLRLADGERPDWLWCLP